MFSCCIDCAIN